MKRRVQSRQTNNAYINPFFLLPSEIIGVLVFCSETLYLRAFATRMALGLVDRGSYAFFESSLEAEIHSLLRFFFNGVCSFPLSVTKVDVVWPFMRRLASLALCSDLYGSIFDDFWHSHPKLDDFFQSIVLSHINQRKKIIHSSECDDIDYRRLLEESDLMEPNTRRLFVYHCLVMSKYAKTRRFGIMKAGLFAPHTHFYVYDKIRVPCDNTTHHIMPVLYDDASKIDLRGLYPLSTTPDVSLNAFFRGLYHLSRGNLYITCGDISPPLPLERLIRHTRDGDEFRACLLDCVTSIRNTRVMNVFALAFRLAQS